MTERLSFPVWMSAVSVALADIVARFHDARLPHPPTPSFGPHVYALYGAIDPEVAAVMVMRDAIEAQRQSDLAFAAHGFPVGG